MFETSANPLVQYLTDALMVVLMVIVKEYHSLSEEYLLQYCIAQNHTQINLMQHGCRDYQLHHHDTTIFIITQPHHVCTCTYIQSLDRQYNSKTKAIGQAIPTQPIYTYIHMYIQNICKSMLHTPQKSCIYIAMQQCTEH